MTTKYPNITVVLINILLLRIVVPADYPIVTMFFVYLTLIKIFSFIYRVILVIPESIRIWEEVTGETM